MEQDHPRRQREGGVISSPARDATEGRSTLLLIVAVAGAAVMHFVPQVRDYLTTTWMIVGLGGAAFLSLVLLQGWAADERDDRVARWHWILLIVYLVHQFEEHGIDLLGRRYFLITYAQDLIGEFGPGNRFVLTPLAIYRTNTLVVWLLFLTAVWGGRRFIWPGLAAGGLVLTNGVFHVGVALWRWEYNPGLGSAVFLFLPAGLLYFRFVRQHCAITWPGIAGGVLFGVAAHAVLLLDIRFDLRSPPVAAFAVVALAPLIANFLYDRLRRARPQPQQRLET
jgi:hypothetical protein